MAFLLYQATSNESPIYSLFSVHGNTAQDFVLQCDFS